jgi:hypothetical protein
VSQDVLQRLPTMLMQLHMQLTTPASRLMALEDKHGTNIAG